MIKSSSMAKDLRSICLNCLGKLADTEISEQTRAAMLERLTQLLKKQPLEEKTFKDMGIDCRIEENKDTHETRIIIDVPREYLPNSVIERLKEGETASVGFRVSQKLDTNFIGR